MSEPTPLAGAAGNATPTFIPNGQGVPAGNGWTWIVDGFSIFTRGWLIWIAFIVALFFIIVFLSFIPLVGQLALTLITPLIGAGVMIGCKAIEDGEELKIEHLMAGFSTKPNPLLILGVIYLAAALIIMVIFVAIVGISIAAALMTPDQLDPSQVSAAMLSVMLALLVTLGLFVPVAMAFWFAVPLVIFHDVAPVESLKMSFFACLKNIVPFLVYGIVMFVLYIVASIPLGLGLLVAVPLTFTSAYRSYRDIFTT